MLAMFKDVYRENVATAAEVIATIKVLVVHIDTFKSWLAVARTVSVTSSRLASALSEKKAEHATQH